MGFSFVVDSFVSPFHLYSAVERSVATIDKPGNKSWLHKKPVNCLTGLNIKVSLKLNFDHPAVFIISFTFPDV